MRSLTKAFISASGLPAALALITVFISCSYQPTARQPKLKEGGNIFAFTCLCSDVSDNPNRVNTSGAYSDVLDR